VQLPPSQDDAGSYNIIWLGFFTWVLGNPKLGYGEHCLADSCYFNRNLQNDKKFVQVLFWRSLRALLLIYFFKKALR
jgi:hypothetical protein